MKIKVSSEDELLNVASELIHVLANLRKFTLLWEETHGVELKARKKYFEQKADELISKLQVEDHKHPSQVKIEVNANSIQPLSS
jgi:hypothetical protein